MFRRNVGCWELHAKYVVYQFPDAGVALETQVFVLARIV